MTPDDRAAIRRLLQRHDEALAGLRHALEAVHTTHTALRQVCEAAPTPAPAPDADDRLVTMRELLTRIPLSRSTIWKMCRDGHFPPPIQVSRARIGWRWGTVRQWVAAREANPAAARAYFGRAPTPRARRPRRPHE